MEIMEWTRIEKGWHVSQLGTICREADGWYYCPVILKDKYSQGPFRTLREAKEYVEGKG
jgi:hypothetical protein